MASLIFVDHVAAEPATNEYVKPRNSHFFYPENAVPQSRGFDFLIDGSRENAVNLKLKI